MEEDRCHPATAIVPLSTPVLRGAAIELRLVLEPSCAGLVAGPGLDPASLEAAFEVGGARRARGGIPLQACQHDRFEVGRDRYPPRRQRHRFLVKVLAANLDSRLAVEDVGRRCFR